MKIRFSSCLTLAAVLLTAALPVSADAKDKGKGKGHDKGKKKSEKYYNSKYSHDHNKYHNDDRYVYLSRPSSSFVISFGSGYAGRGYYYGPPNAGYYYQRSGVVYYPTREAVPRHYWGGGYDDSYSRTEAEVQRALARRGYYRGPIDGDLGPGSRNAIARYQADHGLRVTGGVNSSLLRSLGL